jgi:hypothetical protein
LSEWGVEMEAVESEVLRDFYLVSVKFECGNVRFRLLGR